ncbi:MAG TPA: hypothetical protein VFM34_07465 [Moraxellaceae bacterium]|nr:hypothetical protein [Moraxellaceae bacterium]
MWHSRIATHFGICGQKQISCRHLRTIKGPRHIDAVREGIRPPDPSHHEPHVAPSTASAATVKLHYWISVTI